MIRARLAPLAALLPPLAVAAALAVVLTTPLAADAQSRTGAPGSSGASGRASGKGGAGAGGGKTGNRIMSDQEKDALAAAGAAIGKKNAEIVVPPAEMILVPPDNVLVVDTNKGRIIAELSPTLAPATVERIQTLARQHFYDGLTFFRVIASFMDQTGDPDNTGQGGSKLPNVKGEFTFRRKGDMPFVSVAQPSGADAGFLGAVPVYSQAPDLMQMTKDGGVAAWGAFCPGVLGMARETEPDTGNSQFFFMREAYPTLERRYTAFGKVLIGQSVVTSIKVGEPVPDPQDKMTRVRLASDLPADEKLVLRRQDPNGSAFKAMVARAREEKGADFSVCDMNLKAQVG